MALEDGAVILPGVGHVLLAEVGTTPPASPGDIDLTGSEPATGWENLGHTSRENAVALTRDGDEPEQRGSWQNPNLRETTPTVTWAFTIPALQVDNQVLSLFFGGGDDSQADSFGVTTASGSSERAMYIVLVDGNTRAGIHVPRVSISAEEAPTFDPENFLEFTLRASVLKDSGNPDLMRWFLAGLGTPA